MPDPNERRKIFDSLAEPAEPAAPKPRSFDAAPAGGEWGAPRSYGGHTGLDQPWQRGEGVGSARAGRVKFAGQRGGYGNRVEVEHDDGHTTTYSHLDSIDVQPGDEIEEGSLLGRVGNTGDSRGAHLHYEVLRGGAKVNPRTTGIVPFRGAREVLRRLSADRKAVFDGLADDRGSVFEALAEQEESQTPAASQNDYSAGPPEAIQQPTRSQPQTPSAQPPPAVAPTPGPAARAPLSPTVNSWDAFERTGTIRPEPVEEDPAAFVKPAQPPDIGEPLLAPSQGQIEQGRDVSQSLAQARENTPQNDQAAVGDQGNSRELGSADAALKVYQDTIRALREDAEGGDAAAREKLLDVYDVTLDGAPADGDIGEYVARQTLERAGYGDVADEYLRRGREAGEHPFSNPQTGRPFTREELLAHARANGGTIKSGLSAAERDELEALRRARPEFPAGEGPALEAVSDGSFAEFERRSAGEFRREALLHTLKNQGLDLTFEELPDEEMERIAAQAGVSDEVGRNAAQLRDGALREIWSQGERLAGHERLGAFASVGEIIRRNPIHFVPFIGGLTDAAIKMREADARRRLAAGEGTIHDQRLLGRARALAGETRTFAGDIAGTVAQSLPFALEFAASGGTSGAVRAGTRGALGGFGETLAGKGLAELPVAAARLPYFMPRTLSSYVDRRAAGEEAHEAAFYALVDTYTEILSEESGGAFKHLKRYVPFLNRVKSPEFLRRGYEQARRFGYHGTFNEWGEERVKDALDLVSGVRPAEEIVGGWADPRQHAVELGSFAVPGVAFAAAGGFQRPEGEAEGAAPNAEEGMSDKGESAPAAHLSPVTPAGQPAASTQPPASNVQQPTPVPEAPETVAAQLEALKAGRRPVVHATPGEAATVPRGMRSFRWFDDSRYIFNPEQVTKDEMVRAIDDGSVGSLLGHVEPGATGQAGVVVAVDRETGAEVQSSRVDTPEGLEAQAAAFSGQHPEAEILTGGEELAAEVLAQREEANRANATVQEPAAAPETQVEATPEPPAAESGVRPRRGATKIAPPQPELPGEQDSAVGNTPGNSIPASNTPAVQTREYVPPPDTERGEVAGLAAQLRQRLAQAETQPEGKAEEPEPTWEQFPEETGSLGVPRAAMPQIKGEHRGAMVQFLKGRGIAHSQEEAAPNTLKPSQAEFSPEKVNKARGFEGEPRSILVSADGHVVDGHHQWLASLADAPDTPIPVIRLDAPIQQLLVEVARFPSSGVDESSQGGKQNANSGVVSAGGGVAAGLGVAGGGTVESDGGQVPVTPTPLSSSNGETVNIPLQGEKPAASEQTQAPAAGRGAKYTQTKEDLLGQGYTEAQADYLLRKQEDRAAGFADASSWTPERLAEEGGNYPRLSDAEGDGPVTVYRAVPKGKRITPGDYVFTSRADAEAFVEEYGRQRGQPEIVSASVTKADLIIPSAASPTEAIFAPRGGGQLVSAARPSDEEPQGREEAGQPTKAEARASVKTENISKRTGLTDTQEEYLAGELEDYAERHLTGTENYPNVESKAEGAEVLASVAQHARQEPLATRYGETETIKVPGDGEFTVENVEAANRLHQKITGQPIEGLPKAKGATVSNGTPRRGGKKPAAGFAEYVESIGGEKRALEVLKRQKAKLDADPEAAEELGRPALDAMIASLRTSLNKGRKVEAVERQLTGEAGRRVETAESFGELKRVVDAHRRKRHPRGKAGDASAAKEAAGTRPVEYLEYDPGRWGQDAKFLRDLSAAKFKVSSESGVPTDYQNGAVDWFAFERAVKGDDAVDDIILGRAKPGGDITGALDSPASFIPQNREEYGQLKAEVITKAKRAWKDLGRPGVFNSDLAYPVELLARLLPELARLGAYHIRQGAAGFADWSRRMAAELGEGVRPHLKRIYVEAVRLAEEARDAAESAVSPIRWVGGKRQFLPVLRRLYEPYRDRRLVEPFFGGGTVGLGLRPEAALANDFNPVLANFHRRVSEGMEYDLPYRATPEDFARARDRYNELLRKGKTETAEAAKLFYYLNQTAHGGLYRVNQKGEFNVGFQHDKLNKPIRPLSSYRDAYKGLEVRRGDFADLEVGANDFVYSDPPYDSEFSSYQADGFGWDEQVRHAEWLASLPAPSVTQNEATPRILDLYEGLGFDVWEIPARRSISRDGSNRGVGSATEMIAFRDIPREHAEYALEGTGARPRSKAKGRLFPQTKAEADEVRKRVRAKLKELLSGNSLASGFYPAHVVSEIMPDLARLGAYHLREIARTVKGATEEKVRELFVSAMVDDLGEGIRPHLRRVYNEAQRLSEGPEKGFESDERSNGIAVEQADSEGVAAHGHGGAGAAGASHRQRASGQILESGGTAGDAPAGGDAGGSSDADGVLRERSFPKTLEDAGLEGGDDRTYSVYSNKQTLEDADEILAEKGTDGAIEFLKSSDDWGAEHTALAYKLLTQLDGQRAVDVAATAARALTRQGQAIQAAQIVSRLSPERVAVVASKVAAEAGTTVKPEQLERLKRLAARALEEEERADNLERKVANLQAQIRRLKDEKEAKPGKLRTTAIGVRATALTKRLDRLEQEARARLAQRKADIAANFTIKPDRKGERGSSPIPDDLADYAVIGAAKLARGLVDFAAWSAEMAADFDEEVRPYLKAIYRRSFETLKAEREALRIERLKRSAVRSVITEETTPDEIDALLADSEEMARLMAEAEDARAAAASAQRLLAKAFEALDPPAPLDRALGILADVWNVPRSLKSTLDLSALGRQGYLGALSDFGAGREAAVAKFKGITKEGFERVVEAIRADEHYRLGRKSGLFLATRAHAAHDSISSLRQIAQREEAFASRIASKIPGVGMSERSYVATLDTLRMAMFSHLADEILANQDLNEGQQRKALEYVAKRVNHLTGRGTLGKSDTLGGLAVFVNGVFFAPRYMVSRFQVLSPLQSARAPKGARLITGKKVGRVLAVHGLALAALALLGFDVEWWDYEDPDWMKARRGEHVYDFAAGLQQPARAVLRSSARAVKGMRGKLKGREATYADIWGDYFERKLHPSAGYAHGAFTGKAMEYDEVTGRRKDFEYLGHVWDEKGRLIPGGGLVDLAAPLFFKDVWAAYQKHGASGVAAAAPAFFGVGYQDYKDRDRVEMSAPSKAMFDEVEKTQYRAGSKYKVAGRERELSAEERSNFERDVRELTDRKLAELSGKPAWLDRYETARPEERRRMLDDVQNDAARAVLGKFKQEWLKRNAAAVAAERESDRQANETRREELNRRRADRAKLPEGAAARAVERMSSRAEQK